MQGRRVGLIASFALAMSFLNFCLYVFHRGHICTSTTGHEPHSATETRKSFSSNTADDSFVESELERIPSFKTPLSHFPRPKKSFELLILVTSSSSPIGTARRHSIRQTWYSRWHNVSHLLPAWGTFFLIGHADSKQLTEGLYQEADKFEDMIIGDFIDHFHNLSIKVMVGFEWVKEFETSSKYILKIDDDVIPVLPNVFAFLFDKETPQSQLYAGNIQLAAVPQRSGKYIVTRLEFPRPYYPRYISGGGILLSRDVAVGMVKAFNVSDIFKIDDVFFGMLALKLGVDPYPSKNFVLDNPDNGPCFCTVDVIVQHGFGVPSCLRKGYEGAFIYIDHHMSKFHASVSQWNRTADHKTSV